MSILCRTDEEISIKSEQFASFNQETPTTQRGNNGTAQTGSVAGALRLVAYRNLVGKQVAQFTPPETEDQANSQGIGKRQIAEALHGVPGLGAMKIQEQLANLKTSGHYTRIMQEVSERVEREAKAQEEAAKWAAKLAEEEAVAAEDQANPYVT